MTSRFLRAAGPALLAITALAAFTVEGPRGGAATALENLEKAPRWAAGGGTLVDTGERGLGGGLEYAIDDSVCALNFIDDVDCMQVHSAIAQALDEWSSGHPAVRFTNVTGQVSPGFPLAALGQARQGAEIDFFGAGAADFPPFRAHLLTGYTIFYERPRSAGIDLTNGQFAPAATPIESADVRFNAERCFYLDPAYARSACVHFPSLVLHEVGHAIGIGHPEERLAMNLDSDTTPNNEIVIDCMAPSRGLRASPHYDGASVALGRDVQGPGRTQRGLTWDDVAARDALYPHCGIQSLPRFSGAWGAFAVSPWGQRGAALQQSDADSAAARSLMACQANGGEGCRVVMRFDGCFAFAEGRSGGAGHASSPRSDHARVDAVLACASAGGTDCRVTDHFCAFD